MDIMNAGERIKIKSEVFTSDDLYEIYGELGYPGIFKCLEFEIIKLNKDSQGDLYECSIVDIDVLKSIIPHKIKDIEVVGTFNILIKDAEPVSNKLFIEYTVQYKKPSMSLEDKIKLLFAERKKMKSAGLSIKSPKLVSNWREIEILRGNKKPISESEKSLLSEVGAGEEGMLDVVLPKQGLTLKLSSSVIPKADADEKQVGSFMRLLRSEIRKFRNSQKELSLPVEKVLYGKKILTRNGIYLKEGTFKELFSHMVENAFHSEKTPISKKDNYIGLELELVYSGNEKLLKELMVSRGLYKNVTLVMDQSVQACHNTGYRGIELTVLCKQEELLSVLTKLNQVFENPDIDAYVNRSCGLHVHIDMRNRDHKKAFKNLVRVQDVMRGAQPKGRIKNIHCIPNKTDEFAIIKDRGDRFDRYWVVNPNSYEKHSSLEVRVHEGTVDSGSIFNWVQFILSVVDHKEVIPTGNYKLASDLVSLGVSIPNESVSYVDNRVAKFKSLTA